MVIIGGWPRSVKLMPKKMMFCVNFLHPHGYTENLYWPRREDRLYVLKDLWNFILAIEGKYTLEVVDWGCEKDFIIDFLHILFLNFQFCRQKLRNKLKKSKNPR